MDSVLEFFREKKPWSRYKDLILGYYLEPYLAKVARLGKPIAVVDCFAGPGRFGDGELGSPLIIAEKLRKLQDRGVKVLGYFIENDSVLYEKLSDNTSTLQIPKMIRQGSFRDYVSEISKLASTHTIFVYLDPIKPSHLQFNDLKSVYDQLTSGQSVETLINFMSTGFLRAVWGLKDQMFEDDSLQTDNPAVLRWNSIAGGSYWQDIAFGTAESRSSRTDQLAGGYADKLHKWFKYVLTFPIREAHGNEFPKYHLIFGSRYPDAVDLMNRAMVKARRESLGAQFIKGMLFNVQPETEDIDPEVIRQIIVDTAIKCGRTTWKNLRIQATLYKPCMYNDSEFNRAIKDAIQNRELHSDCPGSKIEENALIWPKDECAK